MSIAQVSPREAEQIRQQLRSAIGELTSRGLKVASKWAGELLVGLPPVPASSSSFGAAAAPAGDLASDQLILAKLYLDSGEFQRAHATICDTANNPKENFVKWYSHYLAGEQLKEERMMELTDPLERCKVANPNLQSLRGELSDRHNAGELDGFGLYLFGIVLKELDVTDANIPMNSRDVLLESVANYPWNWSAWLELADLCSNSEVPELPQVGDGSSAEYMKHFFLAQVLMEQQRCEEALRDYLEPLAAKFPRSNFLRAQNAMVHYNMRNFDEAQQDFESIRQDDPFRLEQLDTFSNILYVKECKAELSHLAHTAVKIDKYRPETCCIIGNYYSLKAQHEKAVLYFQRALKLNRKYLSAWTLMGHEFVEMKNTAAAIESYRRAVDINPRDYRAWYGLGQTYEILQMYFYALYYYNKATSLRPYDPRMWCAKGGCFRRLDRKQDAIKSYERALGNNDSEGIATIKLAKLYREEGEHTKASKCYSRHLEQRDTAEVESPDTVEALLFLAHYYKGLRQLSLAAQHCSRLLDYNGPEKEEAKALLREIRTLESEDNYLSNVSTTHEQDNSLFSP